MLERIYSLETEYAVTHVPAPGARRGAEPGDVASALQRVVRERHGTPGGDYLLNGSRVYLDQGHAEWCLPECRSAGEAMIYDRAADTLLAESIAQAERLLAAMGMPGRIRIVKNNVDPQGSTYGCHENYMAAAETVWLDKVDHLRFSLRALLPFLATRQVLCGAGRVGWGENGREECRFQLSQRADFISELVSSQTVRDRAIVNLGRETEPFAAGPYRRLHLILGDANPSPWATRIKLGTTGIVLRMIEELGLTDVPHLVDPLAALRTVSRDTGCTAVLPLRDGRAFTALDVQRLYCEQAADFLEAHGFSDDEEWTVTEWAAALDALAADPAQLAGRADWVTKRLLIERRLEQIGAGWERLDRDAQARTAALRLDIEYHELRTGASPRLQLLADPGEIGLPPEAVRRAREDPPPHTRARIRGDLVRAARRGVAVSVVNWNRVEVGGAGFDLADPMAFFDPAVFRAVGGAP